MPERPNVLFVIADDLAYGDLGCHGNTTVETPRIDALYGESTRLTRFYGGPVCSPARAELMTGRYSYRTGVVDTFKGRSTLRPGEVTLAEILSDAGYRTGLFGKWHLGDEPPSRPEDSGFDETLYHRGGGLSQPGNLPENRGDGGYFDPVCTRNGARVETDGYCTDVFAAATAEFVTDAAGDEPFFAYLATNAPHVPLQVPEKDAEPYRERGCSERRARLYGMVSNIDANVGRLLDALDRAGVAEETIVVFTSDHGPSRRATQVARDGSGRTSRAPRFNAGLRDRKGTVYEGGIRVPFLVRWPAVDGGNDVDGVAHFPDVLPTVAGAADVELPDGRQIDGRDLGPLVAGDERPGERRIVRQWHRGDDPELYHNCAVVGERFKLVNGVELYDLDADPGETRDVAARHPEVVTAFREAYEAWFEDVTAAGFDPVRTEIGHDDADPVLLTRQDCRGLAQGWSDSSAVGHWNVTFVKGGTYRFAVTVGGSPNFDSGEQVTLQVRGETHSARPTRGSPIRAFEVDVESGPARVEASAILGGDRYGAQDIEITRIEE